ncbi:AsmA family protein [Myroides sp. LJL119]
MKLSKKRITLLVITAVALIVYFFGQAMLNMYLRHELPSIIAQKNDSQYNLSYEKVTFTILLGELSLNKVEITAKNQHESDSVTRFNAYIDKISISGVDYWELIKKHNLKADKISLVSPSFQVDKAKTDLLGEKKTLKLTNSININKIVVANAHVKITDVNHKNPLIEVFNFHAKINQVQFSEQTKNKPIPFTYKDYLLSSDSVSANLNQNLKLHLGPINITPTDFDLAYAKIRPIYPDDRGNINTNIVKLDMPGLKLSNTDWGYDKDENFYLKIDKIISDSARVDIVSKKVNNTQNKLNHADNTLPSLVPFNLAINQIAIKNLNFNSLDTWQTKGTTILINQINNTRNKNLHINSLHLKDAQITHYPKTDFNAPSVRLKQISDHINIDSFAISNASFFLKHTNLAQNTLEIRQINSLMQNITIDPKTTLEKVPFTFTKNNLTTKKLHYNTNDTYDLYADNLELDLQKVKLTNLIMKPKFTRAKIVSMNKTAVDIYNLQANLIVLENYKWYFDQKGVFNLTSSLLSLDRVNANIYRDKTPPHDTTYKPLFSADLRKLNFGLNIENVKILRSNLEYEEYDANAVAPGKLTFSSFYANIDNVSSAYSHTSLPNTQIHVNAQFMNAAPLVVDWNFNVLDTQDNFNIKGNIKNFNTDAMQPFLQPYIKASTQGNIDLVEFNFSGNNTSATGYFGMNYKDLKVTLYQKDGKVKRKFLSAIGNLFIRKNTHGQTKTVEIKPVKRSQEKSFFNYLWLCVLQGLKQTIL